MDTSVCQNLNCDGLELWAEDRDSAEGSTSQRGLAMCTLQWVSEASECAVCAQSVTFTLIAAQILAQVAWMHFNNAVCKASINRPVNGLF
jgi:hypothetical protein